MKKPVQLWTIFYCLLGCKVFMIEVLNLLFGQEGIYRYKYHIFFFTFGFNNPLQFSDPTGLSGECEGCPEFAMPVFTIRYLQQNSMLQLESYYHAMRQSSNPVYRNLGMTAYREGVRAARDLSQRGRKLHYSESEARASQNSKYLDGIGKMVTYGITGTMIAAVASPALVQGMVDGFGAGAIQRMGVETGLQMGTSLVLRGDLNGVDYADILTSGVFGKSAFLGHAMLDLDLSGGLKDSFGILGERKSIWATTVDGLVGGFNTGYGQLLKKSEIDISIINFISTFNGGARTVVGQVSTLDK